MSKGKGVVVLLLPFVPFALCLLPFALHAQQLLDRIVARVNGYAITLSDVKAAVALGIVKGDPAGDSAIEPLLHRQLVLAEVATFVPPEPPAADIDREAAAIRTRVGPKLNAIMESPGLDCAR